MSAASTRRIDFDPELDDLTRSTIVELVDEWRLPELDGALEVQKLSGGASNVNVRIRSAHGVWALRVCAPDARRWGVVRAAAIQAQRDAAVLGLAPEIIATHLPEGHFLSEYVDGLTVTSEYVREGDLLPLIANTLLSLKRGTTESREFSPFDDLRTFLELGDSEGAPVTDDLTEFLAAALRIEALFETWDAPRGFCHSDLVPQNFILTDGTLKLVDFDYAGNGWVSFELGSFACQAELTDAETEAFLRAYDPEFDAGQRARVELMRAIAGLREALWCFMAEPILSSSTKPLDGWTYAQHASRNLGQARLVMASELLPSYLTEARHVRPGARF